MRAGDDGRQDELLGGMVAELMRGMEEPVRKVEGVGDGFLDGEFFFFFLLGVWGGGELSLGNVRV